MSVQTSNLKKLISSYMRQSDFRTLEELANHINDKLMPPISGSLDTKVIHGNDFSKLYGGTISRVALQTIGFFFCCELAELPDGLNPSEFHTKVESYIVADIRLQLTVILENRIGVGTTNRDQSRIEKAITNFRPSLETLYGLEITSKKEGLTQSDVDWLSQRVSCGDVSTIKDILDRGSKLADRDICDLAKKLLDRCIETDMSNSIDSDVASFDSQKPEVDVKRSKNFERSRSQIASLRWPKPYRNQWVYVESGIGSLSRHTGIIKDFFRDNDDTKQKSEESKIISDKGMEHIPPSAENFAFVYDPNQTNYIAKFKIVGESSGPKIEWKVPERFKQPAYLALVRAIRRRELLEDRELIGVTAGLTEHNKTIEIHKCRFASVIATHYLAGTNIYDVNGNRLYDGLKHVASDSQWHLIHSQSCPNVLRISSLIITKDSKLICIFDQTSSFFTQKTWQPLVNGFVTIDDYRAACNGKNDYITFPQLAKQTIMRKLEHRCGIWVDQGNLPDSAGPKDKVISLEPKDIKVDIVGMALDTIRGRIPTVFARTTLDIESRAVCETLTSRDIVHRVFKLIKDYPQASYQEMLESSSYQDAEMLRANLFFTLKFEPEPAAVEVQESKMQGKVD